MKDQLTLIKAFGKAGKSYEDWKLIFVGPVDDLEYKRELDDVILKLELNERIEFKGFIERDQLSELYDSASIFCLPSKFWESAGQVKYEAIAAGMPVVSSNIPCKEDNEELGIIVFNAGDYEELANILEGLMEKDITRRTNSENSQLRIKSYKQVVNELLHLLK